MLPNVVSWCSPQPFTVNIINTRCRNCWIHRFVENVVFKNRFSVILVTFRLLIHNLLFIPPLQVDNCWWFLRRLYCLLRGILVFKVHCTFLSLCYTWLSFSIITLFYINVMVFWGIIHEMIERVSISLPYSSTVVINMVFVSIKSLQLPDSCNETSTAQQGTFHCVSVTVSK